MERVVEIIAGLECVVGRELGCGGAWRRHCNEDSVKVVDDRDEIMRSKEDSKPFVFAGQRG